MPKAIKAKLVLLLERSEIFLLQKSDSSAKEKIDPQSLFWVSGNVPTWKSYMLRISPLESIELVCR